jgi:hypothetical protein
MAATLKLNCWVLGDDTSQVFEVKIANTESVSALKKAIKNEKIALQHFDADSLTLCKVSIPGGRHLQQNLANLDLTNETSLSSMDDLVDVFSHEPPRKHLHIVVKPPDGERLSRNLSLLITHDIPCSSCLPNGVVRSFYPRTQLLR